MRDDPWLAERLGVAALTWEQGDDPAAVRAAAEERAPAFAQAKVAASDLTTVNELEARGFRVVDVNVTVERRGGEPSEPSASACAVRRAVTSDREAVLEIAAGHYDVSRFHMDPRIEPTVAAELKRAWADAYLRGERGDELLVGLLGGRVAGFLGVVADGTSRVIDLVAVRAPDRGLGVGRALVSQLLGTAPASVRAGTQVANVAALRFYERLGFSVRDARYVLHLHT